MKFYSKVLLVLLLSVLLLSVSCSRKSDVSIDLDYTTHKLVLMNTTDEHQYILPFNYMENKPDESIGLSKIYTIVEQKRNKFENTMLFSAGDVIQGSLVGELEALIEPLEGDEYQSIIKVFNYMGYDAAAVGNHEITDFGLEFFQRALNNSNFPWVSANLKKAYSPSESYVEPYVILERNIDGNPIRIGVIGFLPPQVNVWGRHFIEGKLIVEDIIETANRYIPVVREKSDIVIVLAHSGINPGVEESANLENTGYLLAQIEGVDALILGHRHDWFPRDFEGIPNIDNEKGLVHGVPTTLAASWGRALGVIELDLAYENGNWSVIDGHSYLKPVVDVQSHPEIEQIVADIHQRTVNYVQTPIGKTGQIIASYFSRILDSPLTQLINNAQLWYGKELLRGSEYENIPLLSASAAFIAGREGPDYYTSVTGDINIGDVTDMYIYPNTINIVKLNGSQVIEYLEHAARNFNTVDPMSLEDQHIINYQVRAFNFDILEGIDYTFDIRQPIGSRVVEATYNGEKLNADMQFLIIMNNYRASGGGDYPYMSDENIILNSTDVNREAVISYIRNYDVINPVPSRNWRIKSFNPSGNLLFRSSPSGKGYIERYNLNGLDFLNIDEEGWGIYKVNLDKL